MSTQKGFSLVEVLVSLVLVTSASLALIQQQCSVRHYLKRLNRHTTDSVYVDNHVEQISL